MPGPKRWGQKGHNSSFLEHGHVANKIKCNGIYNNMIANILPPEFTNIPTLPDTGHVVKSSKFNFFRIWSRCISNKMESRMQQHGSSYFFPQIPCLVLAVGSKGQISTFIEYGYVAYQIKGNDTCSNMVVIFFP